MKDDPGKQAAPEEAPPSLAHLAGQALRAMILMDKLGPGDLIKLLSLPQEQGPAGAPRDYVIRLTEEEP